MTLLTERKGSEVNDSACIRYFSRCPVYTFRRDGGCYLLCGQRQSEKEKASMSWIGWAVIGILAGNVILFGGLLIGYRMEKRELEKDEQRGIRR